MSRTSVAAILNAPDAELDYARAANASEELVKPEADTAATDAMIDRLVDAASDGGS